MTERGLAPRTVVVLWWWQWWVVVYLPPPDERLVVRDDGLQAPLPALAGLARLPDQVAQVVRG